MEDEELRELLALASATGAVSSAHYMLASKALATATRQGPIDADYSIADLILERRKQQ